MVFPFKFLHRNDEQTIYIECFTLAHRNFSRKIRRKFFFLFAIRIVKSTSSSRSLQFPICSNSNENVIFDIGSNAFPLLSMGKPWQIRPIHTESIDLITYTNSRTPVHIHTHMVRLFIENSLHVFWRRKWVNLKVKGFRYPSTPFCINDTRTAYTNKQ